MTYAPQSSPALRRLPACVLLVLAASVTALSAQSLQRLKADSRMLKGPGGAVLGTVIAGSEVTTGRIQGDLVEATLEGWITSSSLSAAARDGFDRLVQRPTENLRLAPKGAILARVSRGVGFNRVEEQSGWTHVRRTVWLPRSALQPSAAALASPGPGQVAALRSTPLLTSAEGAPLGTLDSNARAKVLARSGDWVKVQLEGWVRDSDLQPNDDGVLIGVTQAEVRADPARYTGKVVEWRVQYISIQKADELRPEMPSGTPYLLTRGPLPEPGFVYIMLAPSQLERFQAVPPLQELTVRATIKAPTTRFLPTPVVELVSVVKGLGN